jgi:2-oxoglutarate dehydrogenase complex dehydrogenase (E1) component-like enzyme
VHDVDGLNAGYADALLEQYLENPTGFRRVARALRERRERARRHHPGLARLVELLQEDGNGHVPRRAPASAIAGSDGARRARGRRLRAARRDSLAAVAAAMALVTAYRTHGHLAARSTRSAASRSATRRSSRSAASRS